MDYDRLTTLMWLVAALLVLCGLALALAGVWL
jgi:hypothetical protein